MKVVEIKKSKRNDFLINEKVPFAVIESFREIATNLAFVTPDKEGLAKVIMISSASPTEGKSTIAANLAYTMSENGSKVLLLDADLRKPRIAKFFGYSKQDLGLSNFLSGQVDYENLPRQFSSNLSVITSGKIPPNPIELLNSSHFKKLITMASNDFNYIIIDTPPIETVSDCLSISSMVDGVIFVIKHFESTHTSLKSALRRFEFSKTKVLGVVLNSYIGKTKYKYYKYNYRQVKYTYSDSL